MSVNSIWLIVWYLVGVGLGFKIGYHHRGLMITYPFKKKYSTLELKDES